ncbi:VOC family protein [Williamsia sp.]|uniref:VOC family protein n=1 Tax=Williamsia sp. TaxID=1872085 RepID=UPI002F93486A
MKAEDLFHVGIVTHDLEATQTQLSSLLGYEWGPEVGAPIEVTLPPGLVTVEVRCAFSITTPRLEVVRSVPGTFWEPAEGSGVHHAGYWSDDVDADAAELTSQGYVTEATRSGPDGSLFFAFLRSDTGYRMELVTRAAEPHMQQCWAHH